MDVGSLFNQATSAALGGLENEAAQVTAKAEAAAQAAAAKVEAAALAKAQEAAAAAEAEAKKALAAGVAAAENAAAGAAKAEWRKVRPYVIGGGVGLTALVLWLVFK